MRKTARQEGEDCEALQHDAAALGCFLLMAFPTLIIYLAVAYLNRKPAIRKNKSEEYWVNLIAVGIYGELTPNEMPP